jgi:hypothetical protein
MIATLVEGKQLLEAVIASVVAGVGITFVFSIAIWGVARFVDLSRDERTLAAASAAAVAVLALACTAAVLVVAIVAMTSK